MALRALLVVVALAGCTGPYAPSSSEEDPDAASAFAFEGVFELEDCVGIAAFQGMDLAIIQAALPLGYHARDMADMVNAPSPLGRGAVGSYGFQCGDDPGVAQAAIIAFIEPPGIDHSYSGRMFEFYAFTYVSVDPAIHQALEAVQWPMHDADIALAPIGPGSMEIEVRDSRGLVWRSDAWAAEPSQAATRPSSPVTRLYHQTPEGAAILHVEFEDHISRGLGALCHAAGASPVHYQDDCRSASAVPLATWVSTMDSIRVHGAAAFLPGVSP